MTAFLDYRNLVPSSEMNLKIEQEKRLKMRLKIIQEKRLKMKLKIEQEMRLKIEKGIEKEKIEKGDELSKKKELELKKLIVISTKKELELKKLIVISTKKELELKNLVEISTKKELELKKLQKEKDNKKQSDSDEESWANASPPFKMIQDPNQAGKKVVVGFVIEGDKVVGYRPIYNGKKAGEPIISYTKDEWEAED